MKKILILGTITAIAAPIASVVSCGSQKGNLYLHQLDMDDKNFVAQKEHFDISKFSASSMYDATIKSWIDGDTPIITYTDHDGNVQTVSLRVAGIDTPEEHIKNPATGKIDLETTGDEFKWADKARQFGVSQMPAGTTFKLYATGEKSFQRITGSMFYDKDSEGKYKNYSVETIARGLALPLIDGAGIAADKSTPLGLTALALADAYNYAIINKLGFFPLELSEILKTHGVTYLEPVEYRTKTTKWDNKNIYEWLGVTR